MIVMKKGTVRVALVLSAIMLLAYVGIYLWLR